MKWFKRGVTIFLVMLMLVGAAFVPTTSVQAACKHSYQVTKTVKPTCKKAGYVQKKCKKCGATVKTTTPKVGHSIVTTVKKATCTRPGYQIKKCVYCGLVTDQRALASLGHNWVKEKKLGTDKNGTCWKVKCSRCGLADMKYY